MEDKADLMSLLHLKIAPRCLKGPIETTIRGYAFGWQISVPRNRILGLERSLRASFSMVVDDLLGLTIAPLMANARQQVTVWEMM
jgi:hypothetical protein